MRFDLVTLNLVLAIAETRSISRGAEREHLALAAASKRVSDLEARLGVALFERRARGVEPTDAGRELHGALVSAAVAFDKRLRAGLDDAELEQLRMLLLRIEANLGKGSASAPKA